MPTHDDDKLNIFSQQPTTTLTISASDLSNIEASTTCIAVGDSCGSWSNIPTCDFINAIAQPWTVATKISGYDMLNSISAYNEERHYKDMKNDEKETQEPKEKPEPILVPEIESDDVGVYCSISKHKEWCKKYFGVMRIVFNDPATIVFWKDGTKTVVKCAKGEKFNKYHGFAAALLKKMYVSNSKINKVISEMAIDNSKEAKKCCEKCNEERKCSKEPPKNKKKVNKNGKKD